MAYKTNIYGVECELDDDIQVEDVEQEAEPGNALSPEELEQILAEEQQLGE